MQIIVYPGAFMYMCVSIFTSIGSVCQISKWSPTTIIFHQVHVEETVYKKTLEENIL
jgi:hypothetical protein